MCTYVGDSGRKRVLFFLHKTLVMPNAANRLTALPDRIQLGGNLELPTILQYLQLLQYIFLALFNVNIGI